MGYDMGAASTEATIVGFQIVKTKEKGYSEAHPQAQVLGVGYDRTLGGAEMTFRMREYLADEFNAMKKTKTDVRSVPRAMGKLLKEAERVKLILSANNDCFAQIENVMEDIDFKLKVTRDKLLELIDDMLPRVTQPVEKALATSAMSMDNIDQVIIIGGGSRIPKVQELLTAFVGKELGKNLNADEAAALGSVYRTADISSGFKVKKFITKDAVVFPIDVDFSREVEAAEDDVEEKTEAGVKEALETNTGDGIETKGVKAHFALDDSGILTVTNVESVFEKTISVEEQEKREKEWKEATDGIDWSKLGDNIKSFFGTNEEGKGEDE